MLRYTRECFQLFFLALFCFNFSFAKDAPFWKKTPTGNSRCPWESAFPQCLPCEDEDNRQAVERCGQTLLATVPKGQRRNDVSFVVLENNLPHAASLPGGQIVVFSGFLGEMRYEAELAFVLAHELAHVQAKHPEKEQDLLRTAAGQRDAAARRRRCELEADREGLLLMARAGYDPRVGLRFWDRFTGTQQAILLQQLSGTYPSHEERIRALKEMLPEAMRLYRAAPHPRGAGARLPRHAHA